MAPYLRTPRRTASIPTTPRDAPEIVAEAKADDPMAPVTVLVPNNVAGIVARRFLARGLGPDRRGIAAIRFTTLRHLAEHLDGPVLAGGWVKSGDAGTLRWSSPAIGRCLHEPHAAIGLRWLARVGQNDAHGFVPARDLGPRAVGLASHRAAMGHPT